MSSHDISVKQLLLDCKLSDKTNQENKSYLIVFTEAGYETLGDIVKLGEEQLHDDVKFKKLHWKRFKNLKDKLLSNNEEREDSIEIITHETTKGYSQNNNTSTKGEIILDIEEEKKEELEYPERKNWTGIKKISYKNSAPKLNTRPNKVILVVGETGSGKTTLLNSMMNYLFDVKFSDKFRFKLIFEQEQENNKDSQKSVTSSVTSYYVKPCNKDVNFDVTVVDTPGFGDTRGLEFEEKILEDIKKAFTTKLEEITVKSSEPRLTLKQKYIFNQVLSLFGKNIKNNIFTLITFHDGLSEPKVLEALKKENIDCPYYVVNNQSIFMSQKHSSLNNLGI